MSPYIEPLKADQNAEDDAAGEPPDPQVEQLMRCTECEYAAPRSEFVPENYR
jgi:hypothetical protein